MILGPSEDLGLSVFQSVTSSHEMKEKSSEDQDAVVVSDTVHNDEEEAAAADPLQQSRLSVNLNAWNQFLEQGYPHQRPPMADDVPDEPSGTSQQLRDSGIARPSFSASIDLLGGNYFTSSSLYAVH